MNKELLDCLYIFTLGSRREGSNDKWRETTILIRADSVAEIRNYCRINEYLISKDNYEIKCNWERVGRVNFLDIRDMVVKM